MSTNCKGVLIENLEACMQQGVTTSTTTTKAPCNADLPMIEKYATTPLKHSRSFVVN